MKFSLEVESESVGTFDGQIFESARIWPFVSARSDDRDLKLVKICLKSTGAYQK